MRRYILVFFLFICSAAYSQSTINNYKYVIVPEKFSFQKEINQYSLNSSAKQLLESKGFTVFFDNAELPAEIANNKCAALNADLSDKSGMFSTKLILVLKDCRGSIIFQGAPGVSRDKDFSTGYNEALKEAFASLNKVSYAYNGSNGSTTQAVATAVATTAPVIAEKTTPVTTVAKTTETTQQVKTLYAQPIPNGYQLIDTTPQKVLTILKTSVENYFIASNDTVSGIVIKMNENWFFEYYSNGKLVSEKLLVKF